MKEKWSEWDVGMGVVHRKWGMHGCGQGLGEVQVHKKTAI